MTYRVFCIVEGHGDVIAFPILLRRIFNEIFAEYDVVVETPYRLPKGRITLAEHLMPVIQFGIARLRDRANEDDRLLLLISRDADEECPVAVASSIMSIALQVEGSEICSAVIPNEEFESWLIAGSEALTAHTDCNDVAYSVADADSLRSPKSVFERHILREGKTYSETVDQPKFASQFGLNDTTFIRSRSLRRLRDVMERSILGI